MIESLKQNERCFSLCSKEEQECFLKVGAENCLIRWGGKWMNMLSHSNGEKFDFDFTYRIKSDYQPEPQIERCEIILEEQFDDDQKLQYTRHDRGMKVLCLALSDPDFMYFAFEDGLVSSHPRRMSDNDGPADIPKFVVFRKKDK